jgi:hypothetical protein
MGVQTVQDPEIMHDVTTDMPTSSNQIGNADPNMLAEFTA